MTKIEPANTLILGIGNILLQDEGVGIHAVEWLQKKTWSENVHLLDGGTGGFHLLSLFHDYERIIILDATIDEHPVGTVRVIVPKYASDYPASLSAHDIGLKDLVESSTVLGYSPKVYLIVISVANYQELGMELSPELSNCYEKIYKEVKKIIE